MDEGCILYENKRNLKCQNDRYVIKLMFEKKLNALTLIQSNLRQSIETFTNVLKVYLWPCLWENIITIVLSLIGHAAMFYLW